MEDKKEKLIVCLNMMRRLPPAKMEQNLNALIHLFPDLEEDLLTKVDQPMQIEHDSKTGQPFIKCEFNRDGDSYRSPWTNTYHPPSPDGLYPSAKLRDLEEKAQILFEEYRRMYYEGGVSSVYFWEKDDGGFACAFVVKKSVDMVKGLEKGAWESINVVDVKIDNAKKMVTYKITTSIIIDLKLKTNEAGEIVIGGTLNKQKEDTKLIEEKGDYYHLANIGRMIEEMESVMRRDLDQIYIGKTQGILNMTRLSEGREFEKNKEKLRNELFGTLEQKQNH